MRFQCDLTAWKLGFYQEGLQEPIQCYDKYASMLNNNEVKDLADFDTDWHDGTFENIVVDLPCSVEIPSTKSRFDVSTHFSSLPELLQEHEKMLRLAYRKNADRRHPRLQDNGFHISECALLAIR